MELVEGDDSGRSASRVGAIPLDEALPIARQIAEALEAAHEQGIIHRDLKPANIKVRADGAVKVLDFGLAKALEPAPGSASAGRLANSPTITVAGDDDAGMILGTAAYMSPEQAKGRAVDKRTDIWAFGVVLYEMLTGRRAFEGDDVSRHARGGLAPGHRLDGAPRVDARAGSASDARCLERDVRQRLRDIGEARIVLEDPAGARSRRRGRRARDSHRAQPLWRRAIPARALRDRGRRARERGDGGPQTRRRRRSSSLDSR